jgi:beta,beta-carotene 9',10'-dioxygenase
MQTSAMNSAAYAASQRPSQEAVGSSVARGEDLDWAPFRWSRRDATRLPVTVRGTLPRWLRGQLVRTAPAIFAQGQFRARHWFDGLALLYGFSFGQEVQFKQRLLASKSAVDAAGPGPTIASFGTPTQRSAWSRLFKPVPGITDNTNVNVVPWQGAWLAMTEGPYQHVIASDDLATQGLYAYADGLPADAPMTAHPHLDFARGVLVNVAVEYGPKPKIVVYRQGLESHGRVVEGTLPLASVPYVHSFGLSPRHAVLVHHPWTIHPARMLFSNRSFSEHFRWRPEQGTKLWKLDRESGRFTAYETDALFCFHTVHCHDDGDDVVLDMVVHDDPGIVSQVRTASLAHQLPRIAARYVRARLSPGSSHARLEELSAQNFEFPTINVRQSFGQPHRTVWGAALHPTATHGWESEVVRIDVATGAVLGHRERDMTYGEPVFVQKPGASDDEGVLLAVGCHARDERSTLLVLDASSLSPLAHCDVPLCLPMSLHGSFAAAR